MNPFSLGLIFSVITAVGLATWILLLHYKSKTHIFFVIYLLSIAFWASGSAVQTLSSDYQRVSVAVRVMHWGAIFISVFFLHFLYYLTNKIPRKLIVLAYVVGVCFLLLNQTSLFVSGIRPKAPFHYFMTAGPLYPLYIVFFLVSWSYAVYRLYIEFRAALTIKKKQYGLLFLGSLIGYVGGSGAFLPVYDLRFPLLYPYGNFAIVIYMSIMTYAIVRHRFLDIEVVVKKTLVFAGLSSFVIACFSIPLFLLPRLFSNAITGSVQLWLLIGSGMAVAGLVGPLNQILLNVTDRFLFQKKESIKIILNRLSEQVVTILDVEHIGQTILSTLVETFRLESGAIVTYDKSEQTYRLLQNLGLPTEEFVRVIKQYSDKSDIQEYFKNHDSIISMDNPSSLELPMNVLEWINSAKGRVFIPLVIDETQNGFMMLGKKKSDQEFTQEEMDYFPTIASQAELAIRNASLVETVVQEREAKVKAEHLSKRVEFAGLIKHEIKNKLVHIQMPSNATSTYSIPKLKKIFKEQDEEYFLEICDEIVESSKKINFAAEQILIIAQTASGGIDENDDSFQELNFKVIWEDAKRESGLLKKCDFESKIPDGYSVNGNYHALQRVFVNLITNAYDAMSGKTDPLIKLRCSVKNIDGRDVTYFEFEDTGYGIPQEVQGKIFEDGFSTKPKPDAKDLISSGYGKGLAACKIYIEKIHHGKIWFESEINKGTTFKLWIPIKN